LVNDPAAPDIQQMGQEEQHPKSETRRGDIAAEWGAYIATAVFLVSTWLITLNSTAQSPFIFHPLLQSLGITFFAYGIITLQPTSQPHTKAAGLTRHQQAMISGLITIVLGATAIFYTKSINSKPHFTTWHGIFGGISLLWISAQVSFGGSSVWFDGKLLGGGGKAKALWKYHRLSGYMLFPLLLVTSHLGGGWSTWVVDNSHFFVRLVTFTIAPLILLGAVVVRVRTSKMRFF
jgi:hypothetical protein